MNVHPEMKELLNAEMENGLKWWKKTTPTEIKNRLDKKLIAQQKALHTVEDGKELCATKVFLCVCLNHCLTHLPWCDGKYEIVFERKNKEKVIDGRTWRYGVTDPGRYWGGI